MVPYNRKSTSICSCNSCIEGEFVSCLIEKGKSVQLVTEASDDECSAESEFENNFDKEETDTEAYELRSESVNSVLTKKYHHRPFLVFKFAGIVLPIQNFGFWHI